MECIKAPRKVPSITATSQPHSSLIHPTMFEKIVLLLPSFLFAFCLGNGWAGHYQQFGGGIGRAHGKAGGHFGGGQHVYPQHRHSVYGSGPPMGGGAFGGYDSGYGYESDGGMCAMPPEVEEAEQYEHWRQHLPSGCSPPPVEQPFENALLERELRDYQQEFYPHNSSQYGAQHFFNSRSGPHSQQYQNHRHNSHLGNFNLHDNFGPQMSPPFDLGPRLSSRSEGRRPSNFHLGHPGQYNRHNSHLGYNSNNNNNMGNQIPAGAQLQGRLPSRRASAKGGRVAKMGDQPRGGNPLLYDPRRDAVLHLDADTFEATVLGQQNTEAHFVEFYDDTCGHCRHLAPYFRVFADRVKDWPFVRVAAINCADMVNIWTCNQNGLNGTPMFKYFPRDARHPAQGKEIAVPVDKHSPMGLRWLMHTALLQEYEASRGKGFELAYEHKCEYATLCTGTEAQKDPWTGVLDSAQYIAILFELDGAPDSTIGMALNLIYSSPYLVTRRIRVSRPEEVQMPQSGRQQLPYMVVLERGKAEPVLALSTSDPTLSAKLEELITPLMGRMHEAEIAEADGKQNTVVAAIDCEKEPQRCRSLFFVSETDMLKAVHNALVHEVVSSSGDRIRGRQFAALRSFVDALVRWFPTASTSGDQKAVLSRSERAHQVFQRMARLLDQFGRQRELATGKWLGIFRLAEKDFGSPFPLAADWEHCRGSSPLLRGFTCGLWTTFHALTVGAFQDEHLKDPLLPLRAIQGWVANFFTCTECRHHFMAMTGGGDHNNNNQSPNPDNFPLDRTNVSQPSDVVLYLWEAHNRVNARLHRDGHTEDPQFPKQAFPSRLVCPLCWKKRAPRGGQELDAQKTLQFLVKFHANIKPTGEQEAQNH